MERNLGRVCVKRHADEDFKLHEGPGELSALTKARMAVMLSDELGLSRSEAKDIIESFFEQLSETLIAGEAVRLSGFGKFALRDKRQRPGRNPRTGEPVPVAARRVVTFRASQKLRDRVNRTRIAALGAAVDADASETAN